MAKKTFNPPEKVQNALLTYMKSCRDNFDFGTRRANYLKIDKAIQLESETRRLLKSKQNQRLDYFDDIEIGIISPQVDTVQGFLVDLYLTQQPIFAPVTAKKENTTVTQQIHTLNYNHSTMYKWARQLALAFRDLPKYNITAVSVEWAHSTGLTLASDTGVGNSVTDQDAKLGTVSVNGNKITRLDIYNTFYDTTVDAGEVHEKGEYVGHIELVTMVELVKYIRDQQNSGRTVINVRKAVNESKYTSAGSNKFYRPQVVDSAPRPGENSMQTLFTGVNGYNPTQKSKFTASPSDLYERTTMYVRMIPDTFGLSVPMSSDIGIFKLVFVGDTLILCERQETVHNYFNIILAQLREDGIKENTKSVAASVVPYQNLVTKLMDFRLQAAHRATGNRVAYMQGVVEEADVRSNNPSRPIAVKPNPFGMRSVRDAVSELPYTDPAQSVIYQDIAQVKQMANDVNRFNRPQMGQFQKGNKTLGEFREVMNNANAELRVMGLLVENQLMIPLKAIIKANLQMYQSRAELQNLNGETIQIDPVALRSALFEFKLADGLTVKEDIVDTTAVKEMFNVILGDQQVRQGYDVVALVTYLMEMQGAKIKQFEVQAPTQPAAGPGPAAQV